MAWLLVSGGMAYVGAAAVTTSNRTTPASFRGYATGTALHADAVQAGITGPKLADVDEAFSGASVNTAGLTPLFNEMGESVQPANVSGKQAAARGTGLEVGLATPVPNGTPNDNAHQILLAGESDATARPDTPTVTKQIGPIALDPLVYASLLKSEAQAQFGDLLSRCPTVPLVNPFSRGRGEAADAQVINAGTAPPAGSPFAVPVLGTDTPGQNVTHSESFTYPISNGDGTFGLVTEVHMRLAPVRIAGQILITIGGEWILRATVTGKPDNPATPANEGAKIEYAPPAGATPTTNLVLIQQIGPLGALTDLLTITLQQLLGNAGLTLPANPVLNLALGEDPRAIGGDDTSTPTTSADGSNASGAVDVLRLQVLPGVTHLADVRLGHMEVFAQVPPGGFSFNDCGVLKVTKDVVGAVTGPFNFHVACTGLSTADALLPSESDFTLPAGGSKNISLPTGTPCTVTETGKGNATSTLISESGGAGATGANTTNGAVTIPAGLSTVTVAFTNQSNGNLTVIKTSQAGLNGPFTFSATCTPAAPNVPATFTLLPNDSKTFGPITGGTTCSVAETDKGDASVTRIADSTAPNGDGTVFIAGADTQSVAFSNAGPPLVIHKVASGESAGKGPFTFHLDCKDPSGISIALSAADTDFTLASLEDHLIKTDMPDGSTCVVTEVGNGGATSTVPSDTFGDSTDRTVTVTHGQTQVVAFQNNFAPVVKLIITKTVVGTQTTAGAFAFRLDCSQSAAAGAPVLTLPATDATFTLVGGASKSITGLPAGAICALTETDAKGASRTFQEAVGTPNDGVVLIPVNGAASIGVTNTYPTPIVEPPISVGPNVITAPPAALPVTPIKVQPRTVG